MKFRCYGKIVSRSIHKVKRSDGSSYDLYQIVIEEPGQYPSRFQLSTKDATMLGSKDGMFAVGKFATAEGFINGREREVPRKDGGTFKKYECYLSLKTIETAAPMAEPSAQVESASDEVADDIPF